MIASRDHARLGDRTERGDSPPPFTATLLGSIITAAGHHMLASSSPLPDGWVVRDIEVGFVEFGKPTSEAGAYLTQLHAQTAAYGRLPW